MAASTKGPVEVTRLDSVGRLSEYMEAKIVDPITGEALFPGQKGELWLRGPTIMKGNAWRQLICHSYTIHHIIPHNLYGKNKSFCHVRENNV